MWKLNNTLFNNQWVKEAIVREQNNTETKEKYIQHTKPKALVIYF